MVNEINMAKWIVALRSGKYKQTREKLRGSSGAMCCLGVACEISGLGSWVRSNESDGRRLYETFDGVEESVLPRPVASWLFPENLDENPILTEAHTAADGSTHQVECAEGNDFYRLRFGEIANLLESRYLPGKKAEEILAAAA